MLRLSTKKPLTDVIELNGVLYKRRQYMDRINISICSNTDWITAKEYLHQLAGYNPTTKQLSIFGRMAQNRYIKHHSHLPYVSAVTNREGGGTVNMYDIHTDMWLLDMTFTDFQDKGYMATVQPRKEES